MLATEKISVPWKATGPLRGQSLPVEFAMPTCASYIGSESKGSKSSVIISIDVLRNENASAMYCTTSPSAIKKDIYLGMPGPGSSALLVTKSMAIRHGPMGPVKEVRWPG